MITSEETVLGDIECRLSLIAEATRNLRIAVTLLSSVFGNNNRKQYFLLRVYYGSAFLFVND